MYCTGGLVGRRLFRAGTGSNERLSRRACDLSLTTDDTHQHGQPLGRVMQPPPGPFFRLELRIANSEFAIRYSLFT